MLSLYRSSKMCIGRLRTSGSQSYRRGSKRTYVVWTTSSPQPSYQQSCLIDMIILFCSLNKIMLAMLLHPSLRKSMIPILSLQLTWKLLQDVVNKIHELYLLCLDNVNRTKSALKKTPKKHKNELFCPENLLKLFSSFW